MRSIGNEERVQKVVVAVESFVPGGELDFDAVPRLGVQSLGMDDHMIVEGLPLHRDPVCPDGAHPLVGVFEIQNDVGAFGVGPREIDGYRPLQSRKALFGHLEHVLVTHVGKGRLTELGQLPGDSLFRENQ